MACTVRTHATTGREAPTAETRRTLADDPRSRSLRDRQSGYLRPALHVPIPERERFYVGAQRRAGLRGGWGRYWRPVVAALGGLFIIAALAWLGWHVATRWHHRHAHAPAVGVVAAPTVAPAAPPSAKRQTLAPAGAGASASASSAAPPLGGALNAPVTRIEIWKAARRLTVYVGERPAKTYRIALGANAVGPKTRDGDGRTPEGEYYICGRNPTGRYGPALGLSYPNPDDAAKGLTAGVIDAEQHAAINAAWERRVTPPWDTALGGSLFIQGNGVKSDWTRGSIAMEDAAIRELYKWTDDGVPVVLHP
jgi:hypothetical protein